MKNTTTQKITCILGLLCACLIPALAQTTNPVVKITYPETRAVYQRNNDQTSTIYVSGSYYQPIDSVQARLVTEVSGQGIDTDWQTIQRLPSGGVFQGPVRGRTGWYRLQLRVMSGGTIIGQDEVRKVGIGEVFIITGQSNAQGFQDLGAVGAADDRVNCVAYDNTVANSLANPPAPSFQQLTSTAIIGPRGQSAWCWGALGDLIARQYNCPVLFINTAWFGTTSRNWRESADGKSTVYWFNNSVALPTGMPYANLIIALRYYNSLLGLRAILWQQGENDNFPLNITREEYRDNMQYIINKTREDVGAGFISDRYPAWVLARSSYNTGRISLNVINAQNDVINTYNNNVQPGPLTDNIQIPRPGEDVHFGGDGLRQLAQAWYQSMSPTFFVSALPVLPLPQPTVAVGCGPNNSSVTLTLPDGYSSYVWNNSIAGKSLTVNLPGSYRATMKDRFGNTFLSPLVEVKAPILPAAPAISLARSASIAAATDQQICADSVLQLTGITDVANRLQWNGGTVTKVLNVASPGSYTLQALSPYGCRSAGSAPVNLVVRPRLPQPTIRQVGPYSLEATVPFSVTGTTLAYDWRQNNALFVANQNGAVAKVAISGVYTARSKGIFTLANGNNLTCVSNYSNSVDYVIDPNNRGLVVYPNPATSHQVSVETLEDLKNADLQIYTLDGKLVYSEHFDLFNVRRTVNMQGLAGGQYVVRVRAAGFNVAKRFILTN